MIDRTPNTLRTLDLLSRRRLQTDRKEKQRRQSSYQFGSGARILKNLQEDAMLKRLGSYVSYENEALAVAALAFLFCGAVILGFM